MRLSKLLVLLAPIALLACAPAPAPQTGLERPVPTPSAEAAAADLTGAGPVAPEQAVRNFAEAARRVALVAERMCTARTRGIACDFEVQYDDRPRQGVNAFQTLDRQGRPLIVVTLGLIAEARNVDEVAFVIGHEAAHHILGHIAVQQDAARTGARVLAGIAQDGGADARGVRQAAAIGAELGARRFSRAHELEADRLGTEIAFAAGYDPLVGALFFDRLPDPGDRFLGTHPPNAARQQVVRATVALLR